MGDRAQASVEFLMVLGLGMVILLPATLLFYQYSQNSNEELKFGQITRLGNDIANQAEKVYYYSDPSKIEIEGIMPSDVYNLTLQTDWPNKVNIITFWIRSGGKNQSFPFLSRVNINGTFSPRAFSAGKKRISLEVKKTGNTPYVEIRFL